MKNYTLSKHTLTKGEINLYDFGTIRLHAYQTKDPMEDEVFILEKDGNAVMIEAPCFYDNERELTSYIQEKNLHLSGLLVAYHMAGGNMFPGTKVFATENADQYGHTGGGKQLIDSFSDAFGQNFDNTIFTVTDFLTAGETTIDGMKFNILPTGEAYDIEIPEINAVYTHMLGNDCHSIIAGNGHADAVIAQLNGYIQKGYDLILTSHYTPEDLKDVQTKIEYLKNLKKIAAECTDAESFKEEIRKQYPAYSGENYLNMTAGFFFA